jgi:hypothetical protein
MTWLGRRNDPPGSYVDQDKETGLPLERRMRSGGRPLGLINPRLYQLLARDAPGLVDVVTDGNTVKFRPGGGAPHRVRRQGWGLVTISPAGWARWTPPVRLQACRTVTQPLPDPHLDR